MDKKGFILPLILLIFVVIGLFYFSHSLNTISLVNKISSLKSTESESKKVIRAYKSWGTKKFMGREFEGTFRNSYLVDPKGNIAKAYERVNPLKHVKEVLESTLI